MVVEKDGKDGIWRAIVGDVQIRGERSRWNRSAGSIYYMIPTPFWSLGISTEAVRQMSGIAFKELAL